jgi:hypothetical protein
MLLNLRGNELISTLAAFIFVSSVFGENIPAAEFGTKSQKLLAGTWKENSQIFNDDFYLPLYLPLCFAVLGFCMHEKPRKNMLFIMLRTRLFARELLLDLSVSEAYFAVNNNCNDRSSYHSLFS